MLFRTVVKLSIGIQCSLCFQVDFDKTKHLSDKNIKRRRQEREKLIQLEKEREERVRKEREDEERKKEDERLVKAKSVAVTTCFKRPAMFKDHPKLVTPFFS